jgi:hypothetical protein
MKFILFMFSLLLFSNAFADSKEEKARKLFEIQGIERTWQESIDLGRTESKKQAQEMINQMMSQLSPNKEFRAKFDYAVEKFIGSMQTNRTAKDIINVLLPFYASNFSENEFDQLIAFYSSEVARKDIEVSRMATKKVVEAFREPNQKIRENATNEFIKDLQIIAAECNCRKTK